MTVTWDFNTATLVAIAVQIVLVIVFIVRTANTAKSAAEKAEKATKSADEAHEKIAVLTAHFGLYRETVAKEYMDRDAARELKDDLMGAINRLSDRIDEALGSKAPRR